MGIFCAKIEYPPSVCEVIDDLTSAGYEAYAVGGCIRDSLMGRVPNDWDITTSATPEEMLRLFERVGKRTFTTGEKHGTITVLCNDEGFECTTFRTESGYSDGRHPDAVSFSRKLADDLCRRDFTINAMAGAPKSGVVDPYGGRQDIRGKILRCVGDPSVRFGEDALRILRAVRFATVLGFEIDPATADAITEKKDTLVCVSAERKSVEFCKTIMSDDPDRGIDLLYHFGLMELILPGAKRTTKRLSGLPKVLSLRLAAALIESPEVPLAPLKLSNAISSNVKRLLTAPDICGSGAVEARLLMRKYSELAENVCRLYCLHDLLESVKRERSENACVSLSDLSVKGDDLISLGFSGKRIKEMLEALLLKVIYDPSLNQKEVLLGLAEGYDREVKECTE